MKRFLAGCAVALALTATGCSAASEPEATPTATPVPTAAAEPTATPAQFGSVIAGAEAGLREARDNATHCRLVWMTPEDETLPGEGYTCYMGETTAIIRADLTARSLGELAAGVDMESLVKETITALTALGQVPMTEVCGSESAPADTSECDLVLGQSYTSLNEVTAVLDKWSPYL